MSEVAPLKLITKSYTLSKRTRERRLAEKKAKGVKVKAALELETAMDVEEWKHSQQDAWWAKRIGAELVKYYPGHGWEVLVDIRNGIARIYNLYISGQYGWIMKLKDVNDATFSKDIMRIGGEMLRRSGVNQDRMNPEEIAKLQYNSGHKIKVDLS